LGMREPETRDEMREWRRERRDRYPREGYPVEGWNRDGLNQDGWEEPVERRRLPEPRDDIGAFPEPPVIIDRNGPAREAEQPAFPKGSTEQVAKLQILLDR